VTGKPGKAHYAGAYLVTARRVRAWGNAHPDHRCPRCGLTRAEGIARWGKNGEWDSGHITDGQAGGPMRPEHAHCNRSAGASYGNAKREPRSEDPYR
jgi:hypothetical protein